MKMTMLKNNKYFFSVPEVDVQLPVSPAPSCGGNSQWQFNRILQIWFDGDTESCYDLPPNNKYLRLYFKKAKIIQYLKIWGKDLNCSPLNGISPKIPKSGQAGCSECADSICAQMEMVHGTCIYDCTSHLGKYVQTKELHIHYYQPQTVCEINIL